MNERTAGTIGTILKRWVVLIQRAPALVLLLAIASAGSALGYATSHLGINTDVEEMISEQLQWRQHFIHFTENFPHTLNTIVIVIDAPAAGQAEQAAEHLSGALRARGELFMRVDWLSGSDFFRRHGLLYFATEELEQLFEELTLAGPLVTQLARQPDFSGLADLIDLIVRFGQPDEHPLALYEALADAIDAARVGKFSPLSWDSLRSPGAAKAPGREIITVDPVLDFAALMPAEAPIAAIRELAGELARITGPDITVRLTGPTPLMHEELLTVSRGAGLMLLAAVMMVAIVLYVALRSWRLIAASLCSLLLGLAITAGFAAWAVGELNLISIAFAILYVGLGIDFAIHYALRYRELVRQGATNHAALTGTAGDVGVSLVLCAVTTSLGFFAFIPTDFDGVAELGLISGVGMYISLVVTVTVLPAVLALLPLRARDGHAAERAALPLTALPQRHCRTVGLTGLALGLCAALLIPGLEFDSEPMNLRDPDTESVQTYFDLVETSPTPPTSLSLLVDDLDEARRLGVSLATLDDVSHTMSLLDFVPEDQQHKLELIGRFARLLAAALPPGQPQLDSAAQYRALQSLSEQLAATADMPAAARLGDALDMLLARLDALSETGQEALLQLAQDNVFSLFIRRLERLQHALAAAAVSVDDLPDQLREDWIGIDGRYRLDIYPASDITEQQALERFVNSINDVHPEATGLPAVHYQAGRTVQKAFRDALLLATVAISALLMVLLRSALYTLVVLTPLAIAALLTAAAANLAGLSLTFANVIALPLLLGVGVDSGIHMVHRMRTSPPRHGILLGTSTARAVLFSSLTTISSFGNLALSPHPGTASMGILLTIGMLCMLLSTLIMLPSLLAWWTGHRIPPTMPPDNTHA